MWKNEQILTMETEGTRTHARTLHAGPNCSRPTTPAAVKEAKLEHSMNFHGFSVRSIFLSSRRLIQPLVEKKEKLLAKKP